MPDMTPAQLAEYDEFVRRHDTAADNPERDFCSPGDYFSGAAWLAGTDAANAAEVERVVRGRAGANDEIPW